MTHEEHAKAIDVAAKELARAINVAIEDKFSVYLDQRLIGADMKWVIVCHLSKVITVGNARFDN